MQWVQTVSAPARQYVPAGVPPAAAQWAGLTATLAGAGLALWLLFKVCRMLLLRELLHAPGPTAPCCTVALMHADDDDVTLSSVLDNGSLALPDMFAPCTPQKLLPAIFDASRSAQGGRYVRDRGLGGREVFVPDQPSRVTRARGCL